MKRLACLYSILFFSFFVTHISAQKNTGLMKWQQKPVVVDGNISEFTDLPRFCDAGSNLFYEFRNDGENIYFIFYSTNKLTNIKILTSGITILMDTVKLKKDCKNSITMKVQRNDRKMDRPEKNFSASEPDRNSQPPDPNGKVREEAIPDITFTGFYLQDLDAKNFSACFYMKRDSLVKGELVIPTRALFQGNYYKNQDSGVLNFRIQLNELEAPPGLSENGQQNGSDMSRNSEGMQDMPQGDFGSGGMDRNDAGGLPPGGGMRPSEGGDDNRPPDFQREEANYEAVKISGKLKLMKENE
jgi:hypothetical protein